MKKKFISIILIIVVISVLAVSLSACNQASTQGQLANVWQSYENYVYDVEDTSTGKKVNGTYTVTIKEFPEGSSIESFGNTSLKNIKKGILVSSVLNIADTKQTSGCYFNITSNNSYMVPSKSYKIKSINEKEVMNLQGSYDGNQYKYDLKLNDQNKTGSLKLKAPFYDNSEFHQMLRSITTFSTKLKFDFNIPLVAR